MKDLIEKLEDTRDYIKGRTQSINVALKFEELEWLLQALTSVKSAEEVLILQKALNEYITLKHTQEECIGFIDGFKKAMHDFANNSEAMKREYQRAVCVYSDQHRAEFEYRRTEHLNPIVTSYSARAGQYEVGQIYIIKIISK